MTHRLAMISTTTQVAVRSRDYPVDAPLPNVSNLRDVGIEDTVKLKKGLMTIFPALFA